MPSPLDLSKLRVAMVHYWLVTHRGGERVLETLGDIFSQADLFCVVADPEMMSERLRSHRLVTSFVDHIPGARRWHRHFLPLYPLALEQFDLRGYDLVLTSESGPAKGVLTAPQTLHLCYCHTPMRYLWDMYHPYRDAFAAWSPARPAFMLAAHWMRLWDRSTADRVDHFIANSHYTAGRIRKYYQRHATVIHPPVDAALAPPDSGDDHADYYLTVGQLTAYKRVARAIAACNQLRRPLHVVGTGEEYAALRRLAGPTIRFLGNLSDAQVSGQYARCRALLFPGEEDFGMVPVEAMAHGRPVIAFARGGALETVLGASPPHPPFPGATGIFFEDDTTASLVQAIEHFEAYEMVFRAAALREHARQFHSSHFRRRVVALVERLLTRREKRSETAVSASSRTCTAWR